MLGIEYSPPFKNNVAQLDELKKSQTVVAAPPPQVRPSATPPTNDAAERAWAATKDTTSIAILEDFIKHFGSTVYGSMARARLDELRRSRVTVVAPPATKPEAGKLDENRQKIFRNPTLNGMRIDRCAKNWAQDCDEVAATYWCRSRGLSRALAWKVQRSAQQAYRQIDHSICDPSSLFGCDVFYEVTCD